MIEDIEPLGITLNFTDVDVAPPRVQGPLNAEKNDNVSFDGFNNFPVAGFEQVVVIRENNEMEAQRLVNIRRFLGVSVPSEKVVWIWSCPFKRMTILNTHILKALFPSL